MRHWTMALAAAGYYAASQRLFYPAAATATSTTAIQKTAGK